MKKTLGGDRLGSGNRMKVELHNYGRSNNDMGFIFRTTMSAGTLVPFMNDLVLPGDTMDINLDIDMKTLPTVGPLFGSFKVQADVFFFPIRLYQGQLHNNKLGIGLNMANIKLPLISFPSSDLGGVEDKDNAQVNPSCILNYLGIRGIGHDNSGNNTIRDFNAVSLLGYWDIYKNYYANKQEEIGAVIHTPVASISEFTTEIRVLPTPTADPITLPQVPPGVPVSAPASTTTIIQLDYNPTAQPLEEIIFYSNFGSIRGNEIGTIIDDNAGTLTIAYDANRWGSRILTKWNYITANNLANRPIRIQTFDLNLLDDMREEILAHATFSTPFNVTTENKAPFNYLNDESGVVKSILQSQEGLALKTYQSDLFNNWMQTDWIDGAGGINEITAVSTTGDEFQINALLLARKVYDMLNRIAVSGGTYQDWVETVYTHEGYWQCETPVYLGGLIKELVFQEVVSNSEATPTEGSGSQPLGTLAGKGIMGKKHKGGHIIAKIDEPGYVMGIISLTPRIDYSQGNKWDVNLKTMDDLHKPGLDEIGFQELITEQMAYWTTWWDDAVTNSWKQQSAGKQPAWMNYRTNVNKVAGNFAISNDSRFMVLDRRYEAGIDTGDSIAISDLTTYIDPEKFNHIFAQTSLDSQNFWCQVAIHNQARRKISARLMPNL